jgi:hypothetical protein
VKKGWYAHVLGEAPHTFASAAEAVKTLRVCARYPRDNASSLCIYRCFIWSEVEQLAQKALSRSSRLRAFVCCWERLLCWTPGG